MSSLESYLHEKSNKRGNKNLNQVRSFFSENDLEILQNNTISWLEQMVNLPQH